MSAFSSLASDIKRLTAFVIERHTSLLFSSIIARELHLHSSSSRASATTSLSSRFFNHVNEVASSSSATHLFSSLLFSPESSIYLHHHHERRRRHRVLHGSSTTSTKSRFRHQASAHFIAAPSTFIIITSVGDDIAFFTVLQPRQRSRVSAIKPPHISSPTVKLPPEKFAKKDDDPKQGQQQQQQQQDLPTEPKKVQLNSADELFSVIRDRNFHAVGPELSRRAKILSAQYEERKDAKSVSAIRQFVSKLHHIQAAKMSLATHTSIAELIKERTDKESFMDSLQTQQEFMNGIDTDKINSHIEDCIARKEPLIKVLRLLCMQSVTNNGLKPKIFDYYRKEILQTYGFENNLSLQQLERAGLLRVQEQKTYPTIRKTLKLVMEDVNEQNPTDISYVFSGYAPLSVRLAQFLARPGWRSIDEVLRLLPGPTIEEKQVLPTGLQKKKKHNVWNQFSVGQTLPKYKARS
eukprot:XP_011680103.1 PREDICTED: vacuolar protein sorting-associated protein 33A [Strongylocentrotus purpuratus]